MKNNKKKKLKFKDVYSKVNHNPYCQVTNIFKKSTISSNIKNLFHNSWQIILIALVIVTAVLIYTFWNNLIVVLYCLLLILFLFIVTVHYNSYKIKLENNEFYFKIGFQENSIPYNKLGNIYLDKETMKFFFIPFHYYNLKVTYFEDEEKIGIFSFPTFMLNKNDIIKFFSSFDIEVYKSEKETIEKEKKDRKNFYKALGISLGILLIVLFIIAIVLYCFPK